MCRNQFFHFTTGIGAGIVLSVLILTFLLQRKLKVGVNSPSIGPPFRCAFKAVARIRSIRRVLGDPDP
jgi:hypothetical protein